MDRIIGAVTGLATVCLVLSIFASHLQELLAAYLARRAATLDSAIRMMLADPALTRVFFQHPLIRSIAMARPQKLSSSSQNKVSRPNYIPAETFRKVLQTVLMQTYAPQAGGFADVLQKMPDTVLRRSLTTVTIGAANEPDISKAVEGWYSYTMDRLGGLYKRKTQRSLLVLGFVMAVGFNANLIHVTSVLWNTPAARDQANVLALKYTSDPTCRKDPQDVNCGGKIDNWSKLQSQLSTLPLGWSKADEDNLPHWPPTFTQIRAFVIVLIGWLATAVAVSLGSPFWFDLLNQVINLRITGPKPDPPKPDKRKPAASFT
jgi:hypothetical protein